MRQSVAVRDCGLRLLLVDMFNRVLEDIAVKNRSCKYLNYRVVGCMNIVSLMVNNSGSVE